MQTKVLKQIDFTLITLVIFLVALGCLLVYTATWRDEADPLFTLKRQLTWLGAGTVAFLVMALTDYRKWARATPYLYGFIMLLLVAVSLFGSSALGAKRWIALGPFLFQPSEFVKLGIVITLAGFLAGKRRDAGSTRDFVIAHVQVLVPMLLILTQPDLGTSLVLLAILLGVLIAAGARPLHLGAVLGAGVAFMALAVKLHLLKDYQIERLLIFLDPTADPKGAGYNVIQSQIAIGSGGLDGKGLFAGTQSGLNFLPHHDTDFIFSVLGEELGFVGAVLLLGLYLLLITRILFIAATSRDAFGAYLAVGVASMLVFQVVVNVGMTTGMMPVTGIPLPLISYGGSSMVTTLAAMGLVLSVSYRRVS